MLSFCRSVVDLTYLVEVTVHCQININVTNYKVTARTLLKDTCKFASLIFQPTQPILDYPSSNKLSTLKHLSCPDAYIFACSGA